jgi:adenosine deaminase
LKNPEKAKALFQYRDFSHFIECYIVVMRSISKATQFERITYEMLEDEAKQNVKYVEASFSAPDHTRMGLDYFEMMKAIDRGIGKARRNFGVDCNLKIDLVRDYGPEAGMNQLDLISAYRENVVAIDIGGREHVLPARSFASVYERARKMGLHLTAHSGEACGPESIWETIKYLQVERIGHGVSAREDSPLIDYLLRRNISIETCPVSNVKTKIISDIKNHPIRLFFDKGLNVTVNSDDPTMFGTSINNEYQMLHEHLGFTLEELFRIGLNGVESSFLKPNEKYSLRETFCKEFEKLAE